MWFSCRFSVNIFFLYSFLNAARPEAYFTFVIKFNFLLVDDIYLMCTLCCLEKQESFFLFLNSNETLVQDDLDSLAYTINCLQKNISTLSSI